MPTPAEKLAALKSKHADKMDIISGKKKKKSKRKDGLSGEDIYSAKLMTMKDNEKKKVYRFPDINKGVRDNQSLLYWACMKGEIKTIKKLMKKSNPPDINWINSANGMSGAHIAAWQRHGRVLKTLRKLGANMKIKDKKGRTVDDIVAKCSTSNDPRRYTKKKRKLDARKAKEARQQKIIEDTKKQAMKLAAERMAKARGEDGKLNFVR
mgnify:CR=1 FL=1